MNAGITLDIDWAPDFMIDFAAGILREHGVKATWFVTHASPAVERLRATPELFELGLHPNFLPGTTHGASQDEIITFIRELVPEAVSLRTHGLVQSSNLLEAFIDQTAVHTDVSLFLPHAPALEPVAYHYPGNKGLLRIPYFWEDDFEMVRPRPIWHPEALLDGPGLRIFDFHPVHIYLNSPDLEPYTCLKGQFRLSTLSPEQAAGCVHPGQGTQTFFRALVSLLAAGPTWRIADVAAAHRPRLGLG